MTVENVDKPARGRPRAYDPGTALDQATRAFWRKGFSATSIDELSAATGMNRPSLYGAFGDKRALYLTTIDRYIEGARRSMTAALAGGAPLQEELMRVYDIALTMYIPAGDTPRGCFLVGTAVTEAVADDAVRTRLSDCFREFDRAFKLRFRLAQKRGELGAAADAAMLAQLATAVLLTLALRSRVGDARAALRATAQGAIALMCAGTPAKDG
jgi:AcrR family transcriptional regulator